MIFRKAILGKLPEVGSCQHTEGVAACQVKERNVPLLSEKVTKLICKGRNRLPALPKRPAQIQVMIDRLDAAAISIRAASTDTARADFLAKAAWHLFREGDRRYPLAGLVAPKSPERTQYA